MVLIVVALAAAMIVNRTAPVWVQVPVYVLAVLAAMAGFVMTFRDLS
ncbi:putative membrane protein [Rhodococcus opacus]|uniref:Putative membrane protein n=1 Tax=Rhodococcus opacus TaxID=37919 RepID=A0A1B1K0C0_RHOOP|nr:putative membrane protein [Rhodococcus opacus]